MEKKKDDVYSYINDLLDSKDYTDEEFQQVFDIACGDGSPEAMRNLYKYVILKRFCRCNIINLADHLIYNIYKLDDIIGLDKNKIQQDAVYKAYKFGAMNAWKLYDENWEYDVGKSMIHIESIYEELLDEYPGLEYVEESVEIRLRIIIGFAMQMATEYRPKLYFIELLVERWYPDWKTDADFSPGEILQLSAPHPLQIGGMEQKLVDLNFWYYNNKNSGFDIERKIRGTYPPKLTFDDLEIPSMVEMVLERQKNFPKLNEIEYTREGLRSLSYESQLSAFMAYRKDNRHLSREEYYFAYRLSFELEAFLHELWDYSEKRYDHTCRIASSIAKRLTGEDEYGMRQFETKILLCCNNAHWVSSSPQQCRRRRNFVLKKRAEEEASE